MPIVIFVEVQVQKLLLNYRNYCDLRPIKTKQKVAGCFRTKAGADNHARIYGFISSARKNKLNIFNELKSIFQGKTSNIFQGG